MTNQPSFFVAKPEHAGALRPITSLAELETAAREAALLVARDEVALQDAANRLWNTAVDTGLTTSHGNDAILDRLMAAFRSIDVRLDAERNARTGGLVATCMTDIAMKAVEWPWPERIAIGKVTMLAGEGGLGESTLLFDIAARVSRGGDGWPDGDVRNTPGVVLILSSEDDPADTVKPRLQAAGADMSRIFFLSMRRDETGAERGFNLQADLNRLEASTRRRAGRDHRSGHGLSREVRFQWQQRHAGGARRAW